MTTRPDKESDTGSEAADGPVVPRESLDSALDADPPPGFAPRPRGRVGGGLTTRDGVSTEGRASPSNLTNNLGAASPLPPASPQVLSITGTEATEPGSPEGIEGKETTGGGVSTEGGEDSTSNFTNNLGAACPLPPASPQGFPGPATEVAELVTPPSPHQEGVKGSGSTRTTTESPGGNLDTTLSTSPMTLVLVEAKAVATRGPQQGGQSKAATMWSPAGNWLKGSRSRDWRRGAKSQSDRSRGWKEGRAKPAMGLQGIYALKDGGGQGGIGGEGGASGHVGKPGPCPPPPAVGVSA